MPRQLPPLTDIEGAAKALRLRLDKSLSERLIRETARPIFRKCHPDLFQSDRAKTDATKKVAKLNRYIEYLVIYVENRATYEAIQATNAKTNLARHEEERRQEQAERESERTREQAEQRAEENASRRAEAQQEARAGATSPRPEPKDETVYTPPDSGGLYAIEKAIGFLNITFKIYMWVGSALCVAFFVLLFIAYIMVFITYILS